MSKSFTRMFLECVAISVIGSSVLVPIAVFVGKRPTEDVLFSWMSVSLLLGVASSVIRYLLSTARQKREVLLSCDFEEACDYCAATLELFPSHRVHEFQPGTYTFVVYTHTLGPLPVSMTPESLGWVDWVTLKVEPAGNSQTLIKIETLADLNRAAHVILDRAPHNADVIAEFLKKQSAGKD
jgi:hypothetical protein